MIDKPNKPEDTPDLQRQNANWWHKHPMNYDWHGTHPGAEGTREFFAEIDRRFFSASPLYHGVRPFSGLIPFESLGGKRVLEIGCGLGSHSQLLAQSQCRLTAIDITPRAVRLTRERLALSDLQADVQEMDAERMDFADGEFDFVWSWGVIHHSAHTDRIVRQVARVLKPGGEFRFMVYNRRAFDSYVKLARGVLTGKPLRNMSKDDILSYYTDGYIARFYTRAALTELIEDNGLRTKSLSVLGQTSELLPLPGKGPVGRLKYAMLDLVPDLIARPALSSFGSFLFAIATKAPLELY